MQKSKSAFVISEFGFDDVRASENGVPVRPYGRQR